MGLRLNKKEFPNLKHAPYWKYLGPLSYLGQVEMTIPATRFGLYVLINNINISELARNIGMSQQYLKDCCWGRESITSKWAYAISEYLGIPAIELFDNGVILLDEYERINRKAGSSRAEGTNERNEAGSAESESNKADNSAEES